MPATSNHDTDSLITRATQGDASAVSQLFDRQRPRLRKLIAIRIDTRIAARVDPSDVIQEALVDASQAFDRFLQERPLPFYPWLRQITLTRLMQIHRFHLQTQCRSVQREVNLPIGDRSGQELVRHFVAQECSPVEHAQRMENQQRVQDAVAHLSALDREVLVLRYVERLSTTEAAAAMGIVANTYAQRHLRALQRLQRLLNDGEGNR
jgi:RNA polymerase sigma-70 factor (ECF subfamily)